MNRSVFLSLAKGLQRASMIGGISLVGSLLVSSCLTPDFDFDEDPSNPSNGIGGASGDGDGDGDRSAHCNNRTVDADETDTDCGGTDCAPCALGRSCEASGDCENDSCIDGTCQMASCTDGEKNSSETDVDCGGDGCPPCGEEKRCEANSDCESMSCKGGSCAAASCSDRIKNGNESDTDCGGDCDACESGSACVVTADCVQPPADDPSTSVCDSDSGTCVLLCATGLGDCNLQAADGCEANLNTDVTHCGGCGEACAPDNAIGECLGGMCLIKQDEPNNGCLGSFADCNSDNSDGCEVNTNTDAGHCGVCDAVCSDREGEASCSGGLCQITCNEGFSDCDSNARDNGCEVNTDSNASFCGGCEPSNDCPDGNSTQSPFCSMGACGLTDCPSGLGDCDGDNSCTDDLATVSNCGGCGIECTVRDGSPSCDGTDCGILSCDSGGGEVWNDCDGLYVNGCEVDTEASKFRCGGCLPGDENAGGGVDCTDLESDGSKHVTATSCGSGDCSIVSCDTGYADCNGVFADGCEVNTTTNDTHCGGCTSGPTNTWDGGFVCDNLYENGSGSCSASSCEFDSCDADYGDCNNDATLGAAGDGCEVSTLGNDSHCGACGVVCIENAATSGNACSASGGRACNPTCSSSTLYGNCDNNGANGCEAQLQVSEANCGSCGNNCNDSIGNNNISAVDCATGGCEVVTCNSNRADCDGTFSNGCEANTNNSETHCGGCSSGPTSTWDGGENCSSKIGSNSVASVNCGSGSCDVLTCDSNRADCDGSFSNGCEVNTNTSATHCGGCTSGPTDTWDGGVTCASKTNADVTCSGGGCLWSCQSGWKDSDADLQTNGGDCETAIIGVVNDDTTATGSSGGDLSFTHALETSRASNDKRAVVLLLGNKANNVGLPPPVTYAGTTMTRINSEYQNQSFAAVYYLLDTGLPASSTSATVFVDGNGNNPQDWTAHVLELVNIDQSGPINDHRRQGQGGSSCNADLTMNTKTDALVVSILNTAGSDTFTATSGQTTLDKLVSNSANTIAGYFEAVPSGFRQVTWGCSDSQWSHVAVSFNPEGTVN